jgi:hypothetical protein
MLDRFFGGADPLQVPEEPLHLGPPIVLIWLERHFHRRFAVAPPVLDLGQVGNRLDEHLDVFTATEATFCVAERTECRSKPMMTLEAHKSRGTRGTLNQAE